MFDPWLPTQHPHSFQFKIELILLRKISLSIFYKTALKDLFLLTGRDGTLNLYVLFKYCPNRPLQFVKELVFKSKNLGDFAWALRQSVIQYQSKHSLPEEPKPLLPREALRAALKVSDDPIDDSFSQYIFRQPQPQVWSPNIPISIWSFR